MALALETVLSHKVGPFQKHDAPWVVHIPTYVSNFCHIVFLVTSHLLCCRENVYN